MISEKNIDRHEQLEVKLQHGQGAIRMRDDQRQSVRNKVEWFL